MEISLILTYARIVWREIWLHKFLCILIFTLVSFAVLGAGYVFPVKYDVSATIFADNKNILQPLLQNQAAQSQVQNQTRVVSDAIKSPRFLSLVVDQVYDQSEFETAKDKANRASLIGSRLSIRGLGSSYIKVSYTADTPDLAFSTLNAVVDVFLKESSKTQREESRSAFAFIDNQVAQYKDQLLASETRLKRFRSQNYDGRGSNVDSAIAQTRSQIELLKINIEEDQSKISSLKAQLNDEEAFSSQSYRSGVYAERLVELESRLSTMLLTYKDSYPDVVALKYQIQDLKQAYEESENQSTLRAGEKVDLSLNPLYQDLKSKLSDTEVGLTAKKKRLLALNRILEEGFERRKRVAARAAEESELTRDYNVTKSIYEDMLSRRERARLSMTLSYEGEGVSYRIQEPTNYPLAPTGYTFKHFAALGPIVGCFSIIGVFVIFVLLDQRVRNYSDLENIEEVKLLTVIPHVQTPVLERVFKIDAIAFICISLSVSAMYVYGVFKLHSGI